MTSCPVILLQPSVATLPSRASKPTMMWPGNAVQASWTKPGLFTAAVPMITVLIPSSSKRSMVSKSRMPPPNCTGISSPTAFRMDLMADSFLSLPANAPFRSTKCKRRAPLLIQWLAMAPGSSEKTVALSISPCSSRTQWPSLRSIAGISSIAKG